MKDKLSELGYYDGYYEGMRRGITLYAWWKDGVQYVGTCGRTLEQALKEVGDLEYSHLHIGHEPSELR